MYDIKLLKDISWNVEEPVYRADTALSYSTIAKFAREGFNKLDNLFEKVDTPSLTFGSAVDALITGGQEEFDNNFLVADFPIVSDSVLKIVKAAFENYKEDYVILSDIPNEKIIELTELLSYQLNWKPETRAKVIKEQGNEYYSLMYLAGDKKIIDINTKNLVDMAVDALKTSESTKHYFADNNVFNNRFVREYQLKFKATLEGVNYRCMSDLLLIDHEKKIVYPIDLKTSSHYEWDFFESFIQWRYDIQARLYWRIIRHNMDKDPIYKDYILDDYRFIVVNKKTLTPLVWLFEDTKATGTLFYGKDIKLEDPFELGSLLSKYLNNKPNVPVGIDSVNSNSITKWLNTKY
jgi:hypothetical protein